jgi:UDP-N-acetylglucosamine 1-carboxyvinyltransferase
MPLLYPFFSRVDGTSIFTEGIFENRFNVCDELKRKGACINVENNKVIINGCNNMISNELYPKDLRAAASLLIECIIDQKSELHNLYYLERGYDSIYKKLKKIGLKFELE